MTVQAQVETATRLLVASGYFPAGTSDPSLEIVEIPDAEAPKLAQPGVKHVAVDGTVTVTPPPPPPYSFAAAEDTERLRLVNERAATDPAYAALAELSLKGWTR